MSFQVMPLLTMPLLTMPSQSDVIAARPRPTRFRVARWLRIVLFTGIALAVGFSSRSAVAEDVEFTLDNGLQVSLLPSKSPLANKVCVLVLFRFGGDHDPVGQSGMAHLCEHLYVTAAAGETPARNVIQYMRRYPAGSNAQTGDDYTVLAVVAQKDQLDAELTDAAARMFDLRITEADVNRELPRLQQEVSNMFGGILPLAAFNWARQRVRPTVEGGRRGGEPSQVATLTAELCRERCRRYYQPTNATLVVCGAFDETQVKTTVSELFGKGAPGEKIPKPSPRETVKPRLDWELIPVRQRSSGERVVAAAYAMPALASPQAPSALFLAGRLMRSGSSRLRGKLVQVVYAPVDNPSVLLLRCGLDPEERVEAGLGRIDRFLDAIQRVPIPGEGAFHAQFFGTVFATGSIGYTARTVQPYGPAFSHARCKQLGVDNERLMTELDFVRDEHLQNARKALFAPDRRRVVVIKGVTEDAPGKSPGKSKESGETGDAETGDAETGDAETGDAETGKPGKPRRTTPGASAESGTSPKEESNSGGA